MFLSFLILPIDLPCKNTDAPDPSEGITTSRIPPEPASRGPKMPGIASMSIDAVVYPLPADVSSTAVITPVKSPSSVTVILQEAPSPSPPIGTL